MDTRTEKPLPLPCPDHSTGPEAVVLHADEEFQLILPAGHPGVGKEGYPCDAAWADAVGLRVFRWRSYSGCEVRETRWCASGSVR